MFFIYVFMPYIFIELFILIVVGIVAGIVSRFYPLYLGGAGLY